MMKLLSTCLVLLCLMPVAASAQDLSADDIVRQLAPAQKPGLTRSLRGGPAGGQPSGGATRQIVVVPGHQDQVIADKAGLPSVDLRIPFDYNSAVVTPKGQEMLKTLAQALQNPKLQASKFLIGGHTDAKGSEEFNQGLSDRRAQAVRELLVSAHRISPERVVSMGFGKRQLADPKNPEDGVNRRVEIVNMTAN